MSRLRADSLVNYSGSGTPNFKSGVTGAAVTFTGDVTAANGSFTGNVTIDGNLTYKDVTNVDSVGIITAQEGIQVSANGVTVSGVGTFNNPITVAGIATINGGGLDVTGVITATSYSGDGSSLSGVSPSVSGIASGTLANGQTVIIHSDGKVGGISVGISTGTPGITTGIQATANAGGEQPMIGYDPSVDKYLLAFKDGNDNDYGKMAVGTYDSSANHISFGSLVTFESARVDLFKVIHVPSINKNLIIYSDHGNSRVFTAAIVSISGTTPTADGVVVVDNTRTDEADVVYDPDTENVVFAYNGNGGGTLRAKVGTVSASSITLGTEVAWGDGGTEQYPGISYDTDNNKVVVAGRSGKGIVRVGTVSGTSISFGSVFVLNDGYATQWNRCAFDTRNNKTLITFRDGSTGYLASRVATVTGTNVGLGTKAVHTNYGARYIENVYSSDARKVLVKFGDENTSSLSMREMSISGTGVTVGTGASIRPTDSYNTYSDGGMAYDTTNKKAVVMGQKNTSPTYAVARVFTPSVVTESTNLTSSNFLGFSNAAYTDGQTATVQIAGAVDDAQSGLTTASVHYVQNDGTLSTSAGTPSVEAGLALSATEIAIKA